MFTAPFSFEGRINRAEYGKSFGLYIVVAIIMNAIIANMLSQGALFLLLLYIPLVWFFLAQSVKRAHDLGNSGWYVLIPFYTIYLLFPLGQHGSNKYGPNPDGIGEDTYYSDNAPIDKV
ncbi:MAG TPA: DUF805 domain-containing protein [Chitinophagales bacterium]|nr:DUF805 domain-containing protein [Chitinophagales bacterium]HMU69369.1 DUF805 domain-containing protein [Chitinophagales bacterium]HMZ89707.1 DUF805 domain-containing protein [Chitinophagales bacterium]HNF68867.1 DUF805 domain-containing protein [Chitinophagales bacterium]HNI54952.1 DUF805 domain-containing protein [Chitinophagales bacterium]